LKSCPYPSAMGFLQSPCITVFLPLVLFIIVLFNISVNRENQEELFVNHLEILQLKLTNQLDRYFNEFNFSLNTHILKSNGIMGALQEKQNQLVELVEQLSQKQNNQSSALTIVQAKTENISVENEILLNEITGLLQDTERLSAESGNLHDLFEKFFSCSDFTNASRGVWTGESFSPHTCTLPTNYNTQTCFQNKSIVLLMDSQGVWLTSVLVSMLGQCVLKKSGSRCNEGSYFDPFFKPPSEEHCRRCQGCGAKYYQCRDGATLEYIALEHARDNSVVIKGYNTTQETIFSYHFMKKKPDLILFNTGLHEPWRFLQEGVGVDQYQKDLEWMVDLAEKLNTRLVWTQTTSVNSENQPHQWRNITSNDIITEMNTIAEKVMRAHNIPIIDGYSLTQPLEAWSDDGVHYRGGHDSFTKTLARILVSIYCSQEKADSLLSR